MHDSDPGDDENEPGAHTVQTPLPATALAVPGAHGEHTSDVSARVAFDDVPATHGSHRVEPSEAEYLPDGQSAQSLKLFAPGKSRKVPSTQKFSHMAEPLIPDQEPGAQRRQDMRDSTGAYEPGAQSDAYTPSGQNEPMGQTLHGFSFDAFMHTPQRPDTQVGDGQ